jgi:hypothetical protein
MMAGVLVCGAYRCDRIEDFTAGRAAGRRRSSPRPAPHRSPEQQGQALVLMLPSVPTRPLSDYAIGAAIGAAISAVISGDPS